MKMNKGVLGVGVLGLVAIPIAAYCVQNRDPNRLKVTITGGHETDPRDNGRPVVLVAGGLGVKPEVFREAFSHVNPSPNGERPSEERVHDNKRALLDALSRYGVTNGLLDYVSNYYRYRPQEGEMWPAEEATGYATVKNGVVTGIVVTNPGSGYSSPPTVTIEGQPRLKVKVTLAYGRDLRKNGSVKSIALGR